MIDFGQYGLPLDRQRLQIRVMARRDEPLQRRDDHEPSR
jgi:hypothetical protein